MTQAVILAGGLGTRLRPLTRETPKAMIPICGKPFLEWKIEQLRSHGVTNLVICVAYLAELVETYFGDGARLGVNITYSRDGDAFLGPVGALKNAEKYLEHDDVFFVTYGDSYWELDYAEMLRTLESSKSLGIIAVHRHSSTSNAYGRSDSIVVRDDDRVVEPELDKSTPEFHWINYGVSALRKTSLEMIEASDSEETFYGKLINGGGLLAFEVDNRFYEIGTPRGLEDFTYYMLKKVYAKK